MLKGKHIILGVTGGIAAYKSAWLIREWVDRGSNYQGNADMFKRYVESLGILRSEDWELEQNSYAK